MARLSHPNVVAVYDFGAVGERVYVAMELVEGPTLAAWLAALRHGETNLKNLRNVAEHRKDT